MTRPEPWHNWPEGSDVPSERTLRNWRRRADELADAQGAVGACHVCKRATNYRRGTLEMFITISPPKAWRSRPYRLRLCKSCYDIIHQFLDRLQVELRRDMMPADEDE